MELITNSRLRAFRKCARYEALSYVGRWRPVREGEALHYGTLIHIGLEAWGRARMQGRPAEALPDALRAVAGRAWDSEIQAKVDVLLEGYDARYCEEEVEILGVEEEFAVPLLNPATWRESRTWRLAGKIDMRIRRDGDVWIREHKSSSESIDDSFAPYWAKLAMDHQVSAYFIGAESLAGGEPGLSPRGCEYDVIRKPGLRLLRATPEENRKYRKDGGLYAGQREVDESPEEFRGRVREEVLGNLGKYFVRRDVPRTESQLAEFLGDAWDQARVMRESHLAGRSPRNPEACHAYGACPYWQLCSNGGADPADYPHDYIRSEVAHPELSVTIQTKEETDGENGHADGDE